MIGDGDMTYNPRRNILAAIPLREKIAYHLFDLGYSVRKNNFSIKLLKKAKWNSDWESEWNSGCVFEGRN